MNNGGVWVFVGKEEVHLREEIEGCVRGGVGQFSEGDTDRWGERKLVGA